MPLSPETSPSQLYYPHAQAFLAFLGSVSEQCFTPELIWRVQTLSELQPEHTVFYPDAHGRGPQITLQTIEGDDGEMYTTHVDNVEYIMAGTRIEAGAHIGPYCLIGAHVHIGRGADIEAGTFIGAGATIEAGSMIDQGARINAGASLGEQSVVPSGAEVNYDLALPAFTVLKPDSIATQSADPEVPYELVSK